LVHLYTSIYYSKNKDKDNYNKISRGQVPALFLGFKMPFNGRDRKEFSLDGYLESKSII